MEVELHIDCIIQKCSIGRTDLALILGVKSDKQKSDQNRKNVMRKQAKQHKQLQ